MSTDGEQATPLAVGTDRPTSDEEARASKPRSRRRRRCCLICGGSCAAVLLIIAVVILVLALTVFRVKDPVIAMNNLTVQRFAVNFGGAVFSSQLLALNITIVADVSIKNPNAASFRFGATTTSLYYRASEMGVVYGPPGNARAHRTLRLNVTVDVMADQLAGDANLFNDLVAGRIDMATSTKVGGRVRILGVIKRHVDVMMNCSITVAVADRSIVDQNCKKKVWL